MEREVRRQRPDHFSRVNKDMAAEDLARADGYIKNLFVYRFTATVIVPAIQWLIRNVKKLTPARNDAPLSK